MILDCTSCETAKYTVSKILDVAVDNLVTFLLSLDPDSDIYQSPEDFLYNNVCDKFGDPKINYAVLWFHGTRVENGSVFFDKGLLPKKLVESNMHEKLKAMALDLNKVGHSPFSLSTMGKSGEHDEGPFAVLIKDVAIFSPAPYHNYTDMPEMVEDLSGALLGMNYSILIDRYKEITKPYVVSFLSASKGYELPRALWYIWLCLHGEKYIDSAAIANTCFSGDGSIIPPENIVAIERLY